MLNLPEILLPIHPRWCELIASRKKTREVRTTRPKIETPFKCYLYCTLGGYEKGYKINVFDREEVVTCGKVIGEFICDSIESFDIPYPAYFFQIGKFTEKILKDACLTPTEAHLYLKDRTGFAWHITDVVIYDNPKDLSEFYRICEDPYHYCQGCRFGEVIYPESVEISADIEGCMFETRCHNIVRKAPQSWMRVQTRE